jgi:long-chain acyl-CoA synthetase
MMSENLIRLYQESFRKHWDLPAISDYFKEEDHFTYGQAAREIARLHLLMAECKVKKGDKIALYGRSNARWCMAYLAAITYGAVIVPILPDFNSNDVHHILNHSDSVLLFVGDQHWDSIVPRKVERIRAVFSLTDYTCIYDGRGGSGQTLVERVYIKMEEAYPRGFRPENIRFAEVDNRDVVLLNYTSGTTGFSKGVMVTVEKTSKLTP